MELLAHAQRHDERRAPARAARSRGKRASGAE
jgi:hypothetical protein